MILERCIVTGIQIVNNKRTIVVSAAGSTMYEICACGVPMITYSIADNQVLGMNAFEKLGLSVNVGDVRIPGTIIPDEIFSGEVGAEACKMIMDAIDNLSADYELRTKMGRAMQEMIDGCGAERLLNAVSLTASGSEIDE